MASFNMTVEDSSPLITYAPAGSWIDALNDPLLASYSGASYHTTSSQGATATIRFTGTGLTIFGGRRSNYGSYSLAIDGQTIVNGSSQAPTAATRQVLAATSGLPYGPHTAVFTNTGGAGIDIDWVDFETKAGQASSTPKSFDDTDPAIVYSPTPSDWVLNTRAGFINDTLHFSQTPQASASMTFYGEAVALYGTTSPDHANIVVSIDDQAVTLTGGAGGFASQVHTQVLLYYRGDLNSTVQHTINLSRDSSNAGTGPFIDLDSIDVFAAAVPATTISAVAVLGPTSSTFAPSTSTATVRPTGTSAAENTLAPSPSSSGSSGISSHTRKSTGKIIGAAVGGSLVLLSLLAIIAFFCFRRKRNRMAKVEKSMTTISPTLPMQNDLRTPSLPMQRDPYALEAGMKALENPVFPFPVRPMKAASLKRSIAQNYDSDSSFTSHSRDASVLSNGSASPLIQNVPTISVPQPRSNIARKPVPSSLGMNNAGPTRPSKRPPTIDFTQMESPR